MGGGRGRTTTTERIVERRGGRELTPEERALLGVELGLRRGLVGALAQPFTGLASGLAGVISPAGFATPADIPLGPALTGFTAGQFEPSPALAQQLAARRGFEIEAAQQAAAPAIEEAVRATRQAVSTRGFDPASQIGAQEVSRALRPFQQQLAAIGARAAARETAGLIDIPRQDLLQRAQLEEAARQARVGTAFQRQQAELGLLGALGGIVGGGPRTLPTLAQFSPTATTGTTFTTAPRQRRGLFGK